MDLMERNIFNTINMLIDNLKYFYQSREDNVPLNRFNKGWNKLK